MTWNKNMDDAPRDGTAVFLKGGTYNTPYSQLHGFKHDVSLAIYKPAVNKVDPPWYLICDEGGLRILNPEVWTLPQTPEVEG